MVSLQVKYKEIYLEKPNCKSPDLCKTIHRPSYIQIRTGSIFFLHQVVTQKEMHISLEGDVHFQGDTLMHKDNTMSCECGHEM